MAENDPVKSPGAQTADDVPHEALATPPTFIPDRETPEAKSAREAEGLPEPQALKYNVQAKTKGKGSDAPSYSAHTTAKK